MTYPIPYDGATYEDPERPGVYNTVLFSLPPAPGQIPKDSREGLRVGQN